MSGSIVEVWFPKGVVLRPEHAFNDQALLQADKGKHKVLPVGEHDLTPRVPIVPTLEYSLVVFSDGTGEIHSFYPSENSAKQDHQSSAGEYLVDEPVRTINQEVPEQFITGLSNEQLFLFAYLFYIPNNKDARLLVLDYIKQERKNKGLRRM